MARRNRVRLALLVALSAAMAVPAGPLTASATPPSGTPSAAAAARCVRGGSRVHLPHEGSSLVTDSVVVGEAAWLVGFHSGAGRSRSPWIVRRSGSGWQGVTPAPVGPNGGLMGVDATAGGAAWAVGFFTIGRRLHPASQRWNGRRWVAVRVPSSSPTEALVDVSVARDGTVWAVGYRTTQRGPRPVALEWSGGRWVRRDPALPDLAYGALLAVDVGPDGDPWAVGWRADRGPLRPLLLHRMKGAWHAVIPAPAPAAETVLTDVVARGAGRVAVTGYTHEGTDETGLLWQLEGAAWTADDQLRALPGSLIPTGLTFDGAGRPVLSGGSRLVWAYGAMLAVRGARGWRVVRDPAGIQHPSFFRTALVSGGRVLGFGWAPGTAVAASMCGTATTATADAGAAHAAAPRSPAAGGIEPADGRPRVMATALATSGHVRFRDVAGSTGLGMTTETYGATVLDVNGDGWDDVLISRHIGPGRLLLNRHGVFRAGPADPLPTSDRHGCAAADIDRDGHDEAFCAIGAAAGSRIKSNELWRGLWTAHPRSTAAVDGVADATGRGRHATFLDLDGDPYPDLFVTSEPIRVDGLPSVNRAFRNDHGGRFLSAGDLGLDLPVGGTCALSADLAGDRTAEVVVCTEEPWGAGPGVHVFQRIDGRFEDVTRRLGVAPAGAIDAASADLDGDGRMDLVLLSRSGLVVSLRRGDRLVRAWSLRVSAGTALALGDADGDRHPDIYVAQGGASGNAPDRLLLNRGDGRAYRSVAIPTTRAGAAEDVVALDHDHNGLMDFLVLNGHETRGPVQLIAGFR